MLLETKRLILRRFTTDDAGHLFDLDSDPEVMRFLNGGKPTPRDVVEADILPRFLQYHGRFPGFGFWAAIDRATGGFLGWFSLRPLDGADPSEASLGFTALGVHRVTATTYQDNMASRRVMEKAGMTLRRTYRMTAADLGRADTYYLASEDLWAGDDVEYALQKTDWERQERGIA